MDETCLICPRECHGQRKSDKTYCGAGSEIKIAKIGLHKWEEPCISYKNGSGTVFFSGCNLKCVFCQNEEINDGKVGKCVSEDMLAEELLRLEEMGAANINLVTAAPFVREIVPVLEKVKHKLSIPVVYNSSSYEKPETLRLLSGLVDIFLPDIKFFSPDVSFRYASARDYFSVAKEALSEMYRQVGYASFDENGYMYKGVLTRHLVLPRQASDSLKILDYIAKHYDATRFALSLMSQYFPTKAVKDYPEINRKLNPIEYKRVVVHAKNLNFSTGFVQDFLSADMKYVPEFDYGKQKTE